MSTRAIVEFVNAHDVCRLYVHGDGYPDYLGVRVLNAVAIADACDQNLGGLSGYEKDVPADLRPLCGSNVALEPGRMLPMFCTYMALYGHTSVYLSTRDALADAAGDGTDIDYVYRIDFTARSKARRTIPYSEMKKIPLQVTWFDGPGDPSCVEQDAASLQAAAGDPPDSLPKVPVVAATGESNE